MNLKHLSNEELHTRTLAVANQERMTTVEVLWHLKENNKRLLYAKKGYRDLKEYCIKELKYSEGSAWRRISAMKLLVEVPEIQEKIESGNLNLTQLNMAQSHFREVKANLEAKKEVLLNLESQSTKTTERILAEAKPETYIAKPEVKEKAIKGNKLEVTLILDEELQKELEEIQVLLGKPFTKLELLKLMAKEKLAKLRKQNAPKVKTINQSASKRTDLANEQERTAQPLRSKGASKSPSAKPASRYISQATLRKVKQRDQHRCQYKDPNTLKQCEAKFYLQTEHITPFAKGGSHDLQNLQLLCSNHNRLRALEQFGESRMKKYLSQLRS